VTRLASFIVLSTLAAACVPTDDPPAPAQTAVAAQPAPPPAPAPAPQATGRLDPNRPLPSALPSANPFAQHAEAGPRRPSGSARLTAPALRDPDIAPSMAPAPAPMRAEAPAPIAEPPPAPAPSGSVAAPAAPKAPAPPKAPAATAAKARAAPAAAAAAGVFHDNFDRAELGADWNPTSPEWRIVGGRLCGQRARNHPVWLTRKLPLNARIEFDATSASADGDLKVEIWGDGKGFAKGTSYTDATSYLAIFGGWKNQFHVLARLDEHAPGRPEVKVSPGGDYKARPVVANTVYHFKVERTDGKTVRWFVDDIEIIAFADPAPLKGEGHEHLGFNDWEVQVCFDNLQITSLAGA
jgi:hypothetical protein